MPLPSANGRCPRSRSRGRQPSIVVSSVTTIASQPAASARPTRLSTSSSDVDQYSWNQRGASPIAAAHSSIDTDAWLEKTIGTPSGGRGPRDGEVGLVVHQFERADRAEQQRGGEPAAEQLDGGVPAAHVAQHPGDDGPPVERRPVGALGDLVAGAARDVGVGAGVQRLLRPLLEPPGGDRHPRAVAVHARAVDLVLPSAAGACFVHAATVVSVIFEPAAVAAGRTICATRRATRPPDQ